MITGYAGRLASMLNTGGSSIIGLDADVDAYISAESITDAGQQLKVYNFVVALKAASIWSGKWAFIYFFKLDTACPHKINMVNPLDTDGAYRIVWYGSPTMNTSGVIGNGSTVYGNCFVSRNGSSSTGQSNVVHGVATSGGDGTTRAAMGCISNKTVVRGIINYWGETIYLDGTNILPSSFSYIGANTSLSGLVSTASTALSNSAGFILVNRYSDTANYDLYQDGVSLGNIANATYSSSGASDRIQKLFKADKVGDSFYNGTISFACRGLNNVSLSPTEVTAFNNAVAALLA